MMPAAKMMDPVMGVDIHIIQPPGPVPPLPIPHPFVGMLFDPMELAPFVGASVFVNGMPKATAGSEGKALPPHIPIGGMFVPPPPGNECEMFMGSATVLFEGEPASYLALPALSCQSVGMPSPPRAKKKPKPILKLPTSVVMPIPAGPPVLIGGPPTISMTVIGMKVAMGALGKAAGKLKKMMKASKKVKKVSDKIHKAAKKAMDKLGVPPSVQNKVHKSICTVTGHPVDVATGKVFTDSVDFELPGPIPLKWERTWYSTSTYVGPLGHGWHHSYDMALAVVGNAAAIRLGDGRPAAFPILPEGGRYFDRMEKLFLSRDSKGYQLVDAEGLRYRFSASPSVKGEHPLLSITDAHGNRVAFQYDEQGRLETLRDSGGRLLVFRTDSRGRILKVEAPHPDVPGQRIVLFSYDYDNHGDLIAAKDALGGAWGFRYREHLLTQETNRNGLTFQFEYDARNDSARCTRTWGDGGIHDHKLSYDAAAKVTAVTDSLGNTIRYRYAENGLVVRVENSAGHAVATDYNDFNELLRIVDEAGAETRYEYDDLGNRIESVGPDGSALQAGYSGSLLVSATDQMGGKWSWEYDADDRLVSRTDPLGRITRFAYSASGLASVIEPVSGETRFEYDGAGNLTVVTAPDGGRTVMTYDSLGRRLSITDPAGNAQNLAYDLSGRAVRVREADGNIREMEYDPEGNVLRARDAHRSVAFTYSGMNRLTSRSEHGSVVEFLYDKEERLTGLRNEQGSLYEFVLNPGGDILLEKDFEGNPRRMTLDPKGRPVAVERPNGIRTEYRYDACDRVVEIVHSTGETQTFKYRPDGLLKEATNASSRLSWHHDILGSLLKEEQGKHWVASTYDDQGSRVTIDSSLGAKARIGRDRFGEAVEISFGPEPSKPSWSASIDRDNLGFETGRKVPGGIRTAWKRDRMGRPTHHQIVSQRGIRSREYGWESGDRLRSLYDSLSGRIGYEYDRLGTLISMEKPDGSRIFRVPDALGKLFRSPDRDDRRYGPSGQLLEARTANGVARYEYDEEGNLTRKTLDGGHVWTYRWNASGTLGKITRPDGLEVEFEYDPVGRRIGKRFRGVVTRWIWDGDVPLHEWVEGGEVPSDGAGNSAPGLPQQAAARRRHSEMLGNPPAAPPQSGEIPAITWLFEPESFVPMAKLAARSGESILSDHLGSPLAMFDTDGVETWSAGYDIYGKVQIRTGSPAACPFRFPGQYEDDETGLFYNRFRYYDCEIGQYISQDPLGLEAGIDIYGYVLDPLVWSDPFGLAKCGPRRTKHVANRHVSRRKYPDKSKYRNPSNVRKLEDRTMNSPDRVVHQRNGRVRYEKDYGRVIGTRGETSHVVVLDTRKNKVITSFPSAD